jgi:hypothetical protein
MIHPSEINSINTGRWSRVTFEYMGGDYDNVPLVEYEEAETIIEKLEARIRELETESGFHAPPWSYNNE